MMRRVTYFLRVCSGTSSRCHVNLINRATPSQDFINFTLRRSLSVKTSNVEEDLPWTAIEQAAKERIYRDARPNKPFLIVAGKEKLTNRKQRYSIVFEGLPRRKLPALVKRPERISFCDRVITDDFVTLEEAAYLVAVYDHIFSNVTSTAPESNFCTWSSETAELLGPMAHAALKKVLVRLKREVKDDHRLPDIYFAGASMSRFLELKDTGEDGTEGSGYWLPHIDKITNKKYDYSAVLFLNTSDPEFEGGKFTFMDPDADRVISPVAGRLITFTSGFENPHRIEKVSSGKGYTLNCWFTTDQTLAVPEQ